jgi:hypothetical protein
MLSLFVQVHCSHAHPYYLAFEVLQSHARRCGAAVSVCDMQDIPSVLVGPAPDTVTAAVDGIRESCQLGDLVGGVLTAVKEVEEMPAQACRAASAGMYPKGRGLARTM